MEFVGFYSPGNSQGTKGICSWVLLPYKAGLALGRGPFERGRIGVCFCSIRKLEQAVSISRVFSGFRGNSTYILQESAKNFRSAICFKFFYNLGFCVALERQNCCEPWVDTALDLVILCVLTVKRRQPCLANFGRFSANV